MPALRGGGYPRLVIPLSLIFLASMTFLFVKLLKPNTLQVVVNTSSPSRVVNIGSFYTWQEVLAVALAAAVGASAGTLILTYGYPRPELLMSRNPARWRSVAQGLRGAERRIYELLIESGGAMYQNEICMRLNLPKSTVSTALKRLKGRGLVRVERRGLRNLIRLV